MKGIDQVLPALATEVSRVTGLRLSPGAQARLRSTATRAMAARGLTDAGAYRRLVEVDERARDELIAAVTVEESYFFRHPGQLELLRRRILPAVSDRAPDDPVTIWSAGCATGEEPYSLALLLEAQGSVGARILATDVCQRAIDQAQAASYRPWSFRSDIARAHAHRFRASADDRLVLDPEVAARVEFRRHNLVTDPYPSVGARGFDLIVCRNVLLHMHHAAAADVAQRLVDSLAPGGWLVTAPGDPPPVGIAGLGVEGLEAVISPRDGIVYRKRSEGSVRVASVPATTTSRAAPSQRPGSGLRAVRPRGPRRDPGAPPEVPSVEELLAVATTALDAERPTEARAAARAAVFLQPDLAIGHLLLGLAGDAVQDHAAAQRAYLRAAELLAELAPDAEVPHARGELAGRLLGLAATHAGLSGSSGDVA